MAEEMKNVANGEEYEPDLITLADEEGKECTFEVIDAMDHNGVHYMAMVPYVENDEDAEDSELLIMRVGEDEEGEYLDIVEDDEELAQVSEVFKNRLKELYNIDDSQM